MRLHVEHFEDWGELLLELLDQLHWVKLLLERLERLRLLQRLELAGSTAGT